MLNRVIATSSRVKALRASVAEGSAAPGPHREHPGRHDHDHPAASCSCSESPRPSRSARQPAEEGVRRDGGRGQDGAPAPVAHHDASRRPARRPRPGSPAPAGRPARPGPPAGPRSGWRRIPTGPRTRPAAAGGAAGATGRTPRDVSRSLTRPLRRIPTALCRATLTRFGRLASYDPGVTTEPAARAAELRALITEANRAYYELDAPVMADADWDHAFRELQDLEAAYPELATEDSPTRSVGGRPSGALTEVTHLAPMLSLGNAFDEAELRAFDARVRRLLGPDEEPPLVRRGAQDRRPRHLAALRGGPFRPGRHARRRHHGRGCHGQPADHLCHPAAARRAAHPGGPGRGVHAQGGVRACQRGARGGRACRCTPTPATAPPARCARSIPRVTASRRLSAWSYILIEDGPDGLPSTEPPVRCPRPAGAAGLPGGAEPAARPGYRRGAGVPGALG